LSDIIFGGSPNEASFVGDVIYGGDGYDVLVGSSGLDYLSGGGDSDYLLGGGGADTLDGDEGWDILIGSGGNDSLSGGVGNDTLNGGNDDDNLQGGNDEDHLEGGEGHDTLDGGSGVDFLDGGAGNDVLDGGTGADTLVGGADNDTFTLRDWDFATGGEGGNTYNVSGTGIVIVGGSGVDTYRLTGGNEMEVAFVNVMGLTDEEILSLDRSALSALTGATADVIIVNATIDDLLYFNGKLVSGGTYDEAGDPVVHDESHSFDYQDRLMHIDGQMQYPSWSIDGHHVYMPTQISISHSEVQYYGIVNSSGLFYTGEDGRLIAEDYETPGSEEGTYASLSISGWVNSLAGITIIGNGTQATYEWSTDVYRVLAWDWANRSPTDMANIGINGLGQYLYLTGANPVASELGDLVEHDGDEGDAPPVIEEGVSGLISVDVDDVLSAVDGVYLNGTSANDTFEGRSGADELRGEGGDDDLNGRAGDDVVDGGDGSDTITGGRGNDYLYGGAGDDLYISSKKDWHDTIEDTSGANDVISLVDTDLTTDIEIRAERYDLIMTNVVTGASVTVRNQLADGGAIESVVDDNTNELTANDIETLVVSNDATLTGTGGNDTFLGGSSAQTIDGLEGDDFMDGGAGVDAFDGGDGYDTVGYGRASSAIVVDVTDDLVGTGDAAGDTFAGIEAILGSRFADEITVSGQDAYGEAGNDLIVSLSSLYGNYISGGGGSDTLVATDGDMYLDAGDGDDSVTGGSGNDLLEGDGGTDTLIGGDGNDYFVGGAGADILNGGDGYDTASYYTSELETGLTIDLSNTLNNTGDAEGDDFTSVEAVSGSSYDDVMTVGGPVTALFGYDGNDTLTGGANSETLDGGYGDDSLTGGEGDDVLDGFYGADTIDGGDGVDTLSYANHWDAVLVDLADSGNNAGDAAGDVLASIERVIATEYNDVLSASNSAVTFEGGFGDDTLVGGAAADTLVGGEDADLLTGGDDDDTFVFDMESGTDVIADFQIHDGNVTGDLIEIRGRTGMTFTQLMLSAEQVGSDTLIDLGENDTILLANVAWVDLTVQDFSIV